MRIILKPHLKIRLQQRIIPLTNHHIAIRKLEYYGKLRPMVAAYDIIGTEIQIITVYPTTEQEIKNRVLNKRWLIYEKTDVLWFMVKDGMEEEHREVSPGVSIELDKKGELLGIEILNASKVLGSKLGFKTTSPVISYAHKISKA